MATSKRVLIVLAAVLFTVTASISGAQATLLRPKEAGPMGIQMLNELK